MLPNRRLRPLLLDLPTVVALLATILSGCTTHFKILEADVVRAERPTVEVHVETDLDIETWAEPHVVRRWTFVILEEQVFRQNSPEDRASSADFDARGRMLLNDHRRTFSVFMGMGRETREKGGIEVFPSNHDGRYRYRILIPCRFRRSDAYLLESNHTYTMWGKLASYKMGGSGIESNVVKLHVYMK